MIKQWDKEISINHIAKIWIILDHNQKIEAILAKHHLKKILQIKINHVSKKERVQTILITKHHQSILGGRVKISK